MTRIGGYESAPDAGAASWVVAGLRGFAESVLSFVPAGVEAYARIFHPVWRYDRGKQGMKRSLMTDGHGMPLDRVLAPASRHDSPLLASTLDKLAGLGPLPDDIRVHLDAGYDSQKTRDELAGRGIETRSACRCVT